MQRSSRIFTGNSCGKSGSGQLVFRHHRAWLRQFYLVKICHALGVSADYILFGKEEHGDLSTVNAMLSGLDPEYLPYVEEMLRSYIKAITAVKK